MSWTQAPAWTRSRRDPKPADQEAFTRSRTTIGISRSVSFLLPLEIIEVEQPSGDYPRLDALDH
jgi:hypothetical protein